MTFYERYAECCHQRGISPVSQAAADRIGCSKANVSAFAKNGTTPRGDVVAGAAKMLDVSADYLLGIIETPNPLKIDDSLTCEERNMLIMLRELNAEGQEAALAMISGLVAQGIYKKYSKNEF